MKMKLIAFYLPQFHEIEENSKAWGKGFTEWDNVRKAESLFPSHYQPRKPLNDNYYNLLDLETMQWQISTAKKYGLYGFCFYHYWFKDGKKVLEKPAEILLKNLNIDIPFCFSWANEPWTRTWHGASGEKEVLIEQQYGGEKNWKKHFEYLLPFLKDDRYIKIDGRPLFLIYQINKISCFNKMVDYWNELAKKHKIKELYIVDMLTADGKVSRNKRVSASVDFEPGKGRRKKVREKSDTYILEDYDYVCAHMLAIEHKKDELRCMFVDYDDSPRRGNQAVIFQGSTPEKFGIYLQKAMELSETEGNDIVFINAWNEWGEGNYLEPDQKNGYAYLEALQDALQGKHRRIEIPEDTGESIIEDKRAEKFRRYYELCNRWIKNINDGYKIETYFMGNNYYNIAIYGMGELGNRLIEALENTPVNIQYGINKNTWDAFAEIEIKGVEEEERFEGVDCIVVTPINLYEDIVKELREKTDCNIVSLEDVIYGL